MLNEKRGQFLNVLTRVAEEKTAWTAVAGRPDRYGKVTWERIAKSHADYCETNRTMLQAQPAKGAATLEHLDVALASNFGQGIDKPKQHGARGRLRDLLIIADAMRGLGEGLRFGELLAATNLPEQRLWFVLRWAERKLVFESAGDLGWFFYDSEKLAELRRIHAY